MNAVERALVRVSAAVATRSKESLRTALADARAAAPGEAVEEVLLQSYLFLGFPAALNALGLWRRVSGRPPPEPDEVDCAAWVSRGEVVLGAVYAGQYERLRETIRGLHPDMEAWMVMEGYGKVLGRPGLELRTRELCIAALLAVLNTPKQLYSHLRGALNVGATPAQVEEALEIAGGYADETARANARATWARVCGRADGPAGQDA